MQPNLQPTSSQPDPQVASAAAESDTIADSSPHLGRFVNPTRYVWFYFKVPNLRDSGPTLTELQMQFDTVLAAYQTQCKTGTNLTVVLRPGTSHISRQLLHIPRRRWGELNIELTVLHLLDVFVLTIIVEAPGEFLADDLPELKDLKFGQDQVSNYLGSFTNIQAETNDTCLSHTAQQLHKHYLQQFGNPVAAIDTGHAVFLPGPLADEKQTGSPMLGAAFVYPLQTDQDRVQHSDGSWLSPPEEQLLKQLPLAALCHLKAVNSSNLLRDDLSPAVQGHDYDLQQLLAGQLPTVTTDFTAAAKQKEKINQKLKQRKLTELELHELRTVSDNLTDLRSLLTDSSEETRREIHTVSVNRKNLVDATRTWPSGAEQVVEVLYDQIIKGPIAQAESDRDYASSTLKRADIFFESIEASARCLEVQETRWVTIIMIGLGAFAAADLVPSLVGSTAFEQLGFGLRIIVEALVFGLTGIIAFAILSWRRSWRS